MNRAKNRNFRSIRIISQEYLYPSNLTTGIQVCIKSYLNNELSHFKIQRL
ncbi:hypothetical protein wTpre_285 [Wolbachia endosymbiont of Trichogramma pretiosum]|nr:hypothetical protein wTpre_285 [Wolbachia endosymbiont of Trichogramma pretiosum]